MSFFLSRFSDNFSHMQRNDDDSKELNHNVNIEEVDISWVVQPDSEDHSCLREVDKQRFKWKAFMKKHKNLWTDMDWVWHKNHKNFLGKKISDIFISRQKTRNTVKTLIRDGVPPELRGKVWFYMLGANKKMESEEISYATYSSPESFLTISKTNIPKEIEKDVGRTFPTRLLVMNNALEFRMRLTRVLMAYAIRNKVVGYCQSLNYIAGLLLLHMSEEKAFWCLVALLEDLLPTSYYEPSLIGGRVDQNVLQSCIAWRLSKVFDHLKATETLLEPVFCPWFMCLYINTLPLYYVCRVWDCLLWEGNMVLFRIGLTLVASKSRKILECKDFLDIYSLLKQNGIPSFQLERPEPENTDGEDSMSSKSDIQFLIESTFGYKVLRFVPSEVITKFRSKFEEALLERSAQKHRDHQERERIDTLSSSGASQASSKAESHSSIDNDEFSKTRQSIFMFNSQTADAHQLQNLAKEIDDGLTLKVEQFASELQHSLADKNQNTRSY